MKKIIFVFLALIVAGCQGNSELKKNNDNTEIQVYTDKNGMNAEELPFSNFEVTGYEDIITFHGYVKDKLYFSHTVSDNNTIYTTKDLYVYNLSNSTVQKILHMEENARIWDYALLDDGTILYSKFKLPEDINDPIAVSIVSQKDQEQRILHQGYSYNYLNGPTFFKNKSKVYYLLEEIEYDANKKEATALVASFNEVNGHKVENIWKKKASVNDSHIKKDQEVLSTTNPNYSNNISCFFTQNTNDSGASKLYYVVKGSVKSYAFDNFIESAVPLDDYVFVTTTMKSYLLDIKTNEVTEIKGFTLSVSQGKYIKDNSFIFSDQKEGINILEVKAGDIHLKKVNGIYSGVRPSYIVSDDAVYAVGNFTRDSENQIINKIYSIPLE